MEDFEAIKEGDPVTIGAGKQAWIVEDLQPIARVHPGMPLVTLVIGPGEPTSRRRRVACLADLHKVVTS
jgi:hypothetical protein